MFLRRKPKTTAFDKTGKTPALRSSICTGEQTAGFKDDQTGKFTEVMLIRSDEDFAEFLRQYEVRAEDVVRIW